MDLNKIDKLMGVLKKQFESGHIGLLLAQTLPPLRKKLKIELEGRKDNSCNHEPDQRLTALVQTNLPSWFCSFISFGLLVIKLHLNIHYEIMHS